MKIHHTHILIQLIPNLLTQCSPTNKWTEFPRLPPLGSTLVHPGTAHNSVQYPSPYPRWSPSLNSGTGLVGSHPPSPACPLHPPSMMPQQHLVLSTLYCSTMPLFTHLQHQSLPPAGESRMNARTLGIDNLNPFDQ